MTRAQPRLAVVTGASQGLGRALAVALADAGLTVVAGAPDVIEPAVETAGEGRGAIHNIACDVTDEAQVRRLWVIAAAFGTIGWWINNAGLALTGAPLAAMPAADFRRMVDINLIGTMNGCRVAVEGMVRQGSGEIWNVLGAGWDGDPVPGMNGYATTKAALTFLTRALAAEADGSSYIVGGLSPGLVMTEGFFREHARVSDEHRAAREAVINVIGDHPATIAHWIVDALLARQANGAILSWLTPEKIAARRAEQPPRDILSAYRIPPPHPPSGG